MLTSDRLYPARGAGPVHRSIPSGKGPRRRQEPRLQQMEQDLANVALAPLQLVLIALGDKASALTGAGQMVDDQVIGQVSQVKSSVAGVHGHSA